MFCICSTLFRPDLPTTPCCAAIIAVLAPFPVLRDGNACVSRTPDAIYE